MKFNIKKILAATALAVVASSVTALPAMAGWHHHYYRHYHYHHDGSRMAAGLLVGGLIGVMAGSAIANSQDHYYSGSDCYRQRVWSREYCNDEGCYRRIAWRTVCN